MGTWDNVLTAVMAIVASVLLLRQYRQSGRRWQGWALYSFGALAFTAAVQSLYVFGIRIPNQWYEWSSFALVLSLLLAALSMRGH